MLAGHKECPGEIKDDKEMGPIMEYWGMGSKRAKLGANKARVRDYGDHEEGIVKRVRYKGELHESFLPVIDALNRAFEVVNYRDIFELHNGVDSGDCRFGRRDIAALVESKPHD